MWKSLTRHSIGHCSLFSLSYFTNSFHSFSSIYCGLRATENNQKTSSWELLNIAEENSTSSQTSLLSQYLSNQSTVLFAFCSIGKWKEPIIRQANVLDWQHTLRKVISTGNRLTMGDHRSLPLIYVQVSPCSTSLKKTIACFGIREPVLRLDAAEDWELLVQHDMQLKTIGQKLISKDIASWLFKSKDKVFYGFHRYDQPSFVSLLQPSHDADSNLFQLIDQQPPIENVSTTPTSEKIASHLEFNALESWYDFRNMESQQRLSFAERGPDVLRHLEQTIFRFPRDVIFHQLKDWIFVSDTFHHRIVVLTTDGQILGTIGSGVPWLRDSNFSSCAFHEPSGLALDGDILYIADTENGCVRMADLTTSQVRTIFPIDKISTPSNISRALEFCDLDRSMEAAKMVGKICIRDSCLTCSEMAMTAMESFGKPLSVVVHEDHSISILTIVPLGVWTLAYRKSRKQPFTLLSKQVGWESYKTFLSWKEQEPSNGVSIHTMENLVQCIKTESYRPSIFKLDKLENLPPPFTLQSIHEDPADYDAFQYIYPFLRGRRVITDEPIYLIPGIARLVLNVIPPKDYKVVGKTMVHWNMEGPMVSTKAPAGIDDQKVPYGEKSRRQLEGLEEPEDLFLPPPPSVDPLSGLPIIVDVYTFPGNGSITINLVVYMKKQVSSDMDDWRNHIVYDTIQLKIPVRITAYGLETEYVDITSRGEPPFPKFERIHRKSTISVNKQSNHM
eukprot:jgi/Galph1/1004/GphlegSOOS_G5864.1